MNVRMKLTALTASFAALALAAACADSAEDAPPQSEEDAATPTADVPDETIDYQLVQDGVLSVVTISDGNPSAYIDADGEFTGFDNELVREIGTRMGLDLQYTATDFSSVLATVNNGQYDVGAAGVTITDARLETSLFTAPHNFAFLGIVAHQDSGYGSFEDLQGESVAVAAGSVQEEYAVEELDLDPVRFPDQTGAFQAVLGGQVDAWIAPYGSGSQYLEEYPDSEMAMVYSQLNSRNLVGMAVAQDNPGLVEVMNATLDEMVEDGTWYEIYQQFYPDGEVPEDFVPGTGDAEFEVP